ncbi:MAG: marine proteobacterial sortase target protein [Pseudomonadota bacterium]
MAVPAVLQAGVWFFRACVVLLIVVSPLLGMVQAGQALASPGGKVMQPNEARMGTLLFRAEAPGQFIEAPRLGSDIDISVSGPTARGRITQHFTNPTDGWVEAIYVMPLPEDSAVDTLRMVIGDKAIIGDIKERKEARLIYEAAKARGQKAALLTQERPNIFTHEVANIGPGETIVVQVEWQQTIPFDAKGFALRMPLVVAPRFNPKPIVQTVDFDAPGAGGGWGQVIDPVPDRARISPPVLDPAENPSVNPVTLTVRLSAGFEIGALESHHHEVDVDTSDPQSRVVRLKAGAEPADRDFELTWGPKTSALPSVGLFRETVDGKDYVLAFVTPPVVAGGKAGIASKDEEAVSPRKPREVIFVIDNSGSMGGASIRQARKSLLFGLKRLKPGDRFNVIRFDNTVDQVFAQPVLATTAHVTRAMAYVRAIAASGGTMMVPPMEMALRDHGTAPAGAVRQIVFLTDGAIGNEAQLMDMVASKRGRSRVFMVGIGSAPNSYLMSRIAELGRGTFLHIGSTDQVQARMTALFEKLESPAVTQLKLAFDGVSADVTPSMLPDLYRGEPLGVAAQVSGTVGTVKLTGLIGEQPWIVDLPLDKAVASVGISKLWARRKIRDAEIAARIGKLSREVSDREILDLALTHGLMSRLTSLVAVEKEISRPDDQPLTRAEIPLNLPKGWDFEKVFGPRDGKPLQRADGEGSGSEKKAFLPFDADRLGQPDALLAGRGAAGVGASGAAPQMTLSMFAGVAKLNAPMSAHVASLRTQSRSVVLPQTSTDAEVRIWIGLFLVMLSGAFWMWSANFWGAGWGASVRRPHAGQTPLRTRG